MDQDYWKLLVVGDEDVYASIRHMLLEARQGKHLLDWASTYEVGLKMLQEGSYDTVLLDAGLEQHNGTDLACEAIKSGAHLPVIKLTDQESNEEDLEAVQAGVALYLSKSEISPLTLERIIRNAIGHKQIEEGLEEKLRDSEKKYRELIQYAPAGIYEVDFTGKRFTSVSDAMCELSGYSRDELLSMNPFDILDEEGRVLFQERINRWIAGEELEKNVEYNVRAKDGHTIHALLNTTFKRDAEGKPIGATVIGFDITDLRRAEEILKYQHELLETVVRNTPAAISLMRGSDLRVEVVNPAYQVFVSKEELVGKTLDELWLETDQNFVELCRQVLDTGEPYHAIDEPRMIRRFPEGSLEQAYFSWSLFRVDLPHEKGWGILNTAWETTKRKQVEEALLQSQNYIRRLVDTSYEGIWSVDRRGKTTFINQRAAEILDYTVEEIQGRNAFEYLMAGEALAGRETLAKIAAGKSGRVEAHARRKDGTEAVLLVSYSPVLDERGEFQGALAMFNDITERKRAEQALQKTSEQLREYSEQLEARVRERTEEFVTLQRRFVDNVEAERLRVSQELHDGAMQEIYGLMFKLSMLFETSDNPEMQPEVASVIDDLKKINKSLRIVARELRPASLTPFGLEKAMRDYSERISLEHPEFHLSLDLMADGKRLPEHIRLTLFRIYQTALTNVIRHAHAQNVSVHFSFDEERAILKVQDDGKGFKVPERLRTLASQGHLGLAGAAERAEAIGGKLALESSPGKGTQLRVIAPLRTEVERQVSS